MLAGRNIGLCIGIMTMAATWIAGGFLNGSAEAAYSQGRRTGSFNLVALKVVLLVGGCAIRQFCCDFEITSLLSRFSRL